MTLDELLYFIRELIKVEDRVSVIHILEKESRCWIEEVDFAIRMIGSGKPKLLQEETLFSEEMMGEGLYREFQEMQELSKEMYEQIDKFLTNHF